MCIRDRFTAGAETLTSFLCFPFIEKLFLGDLKPTLSTPVSYTHLYAYQALYSIRNNLGESGLHAYRLATPNLSWEKMCIRDRDWRHESLPAYNRQNRILFQWNHYRA